jgi:hypothetical protein
VRTAIAHGLNRILAETRFLRLRDDSESSTNRPETTQLSGMIVPKVGIEPSSARTDQQQTATNRTVEGAAGAPDSASKCTIRGGMDDSLDDSVDDSGERQASDGRLPVEALVVAGSWNLATKPVSTEDTGRLDRRERDDGTCGAS